MRKWAVEHTVRFDDGRERGERLVVKGDTIRSALIEAQRVVLDHVMTREGHASASSITGITLLPGEAVF